MGRLPILMYHNVCKGKEGSKALTIAVNRLDSHFKYLADNGYKTYHLSELKAFEDNGKLSEKSVIITFDDVYVSQLEFAYPLLQKYGLKASFFVPFAYVDGLDTWNTNKEEIMSVAQLKSMDSDVVELGFHSFVHKKYHEMSVYDIEEDFKKCNDFIEANTLDVKNVLAYPYGKFPRKNPEKFTFFECLKQQKMTYGLRIGNKVNSFPFKNNYEVNRIDIKGEDTLLKFKLKLRFGKLKLF